MEYIDDMIIDGFFDSIECSLKFFLDNTGKIFNDTQYTKNRNNHNKKHSHLLLVVL